MIALESDDRDVRQISVLLGVVQAVAHDEPILDLEADVVHLDVDLPPRRLAEQARRPQRRGTARAQYLLQVGQRQPGIDDVLDDDDVAPLERRCRDPSGAGPGRRLRAFAVARHGHEVQRAVAVACAREIRQEHECALQHGDEVHAVGMIAMDFRSQLAHARRISSEVMRMSMAGCSSSEHASHARVTYVRAR